MCEFYVLKSERQECNQLHDIPLNYFFLPFLTSPPPYLFFTSPLHHSTSPHSPLAPLYPLWQPPPPINPHTPQDEVSVNLRAEFRRFGEKGVQLSRLPVPQVFPHSSHLPYKPPFRPSIAITLLPCLSLYHSTTFPPPPTV
ncbi:hypothetical protein Pcinc_010032 [Petrolisthes cinctipes]|uniref:Uncharacterized protein n=1 Tax=Petrolisthes cinctipes TaxID=88211 RepID=A0AAE1KVU3_PETCI|nr:hypothetical protein Pcinc_010032 [Petrolisthes cinctipes]